MALQLVTTLSEVRAWLQERQRAGEEVALVPTMGALHEGHLALVAEAHRVAPRVVLSLFVNPTQFGPKEDLARYPKDLAGDLAKCREAKVDLVFAPEPASLYPPGYQTFVSVEALSQGLEGASRPGHFRGVATIVTQLLCLFRPAVAVFGEKDYQQLQLIRALARDLHLGVYVVGVPTVREPDGLAKSSRNAYLSSQERAQATALSRGLRAAQSLAGRGERGAAVLVEKVRQELRAAGVREDYVALVDADTLAPLERVGGPVKARLLVAGFVGNTRLIDNAPL
jgi:pantoate--beta-alanine ligase